ncbi:serine protease [Lottiidibacillus patelloidae]|uniref:Serine protease n=1 Tax=Lottiidibacillus patelloidae TaxID=2670334 RepID=A0A263BSC3_9BACI|nr:S1C family serine protease [Lottiidibacillus patelloidae]OZM56595.1 serine protease [Lottiidibacillus patelloidae]
MGYYDQDYDNIQKQKGNRKGTWLALIFAAVLGGFIVLFSMPALSNIGLLPYEFATPATGDEEEVNVDNNVNRTVNLSITTNVTEAVEKIADAVVSVINIQKTSFWSETASEAGAGSGVIYKKANGKAFIVTNHHVVEGASQIEVSLTDGTRVPATLLGSDVWTDLAVLEIDATSVKSIAEFGNSDTLKPGEPAIAIGNPLGQFSSSVTQGIISATERTIPVDINKDGSIDWNADVIQTDAAINPGNSGGALINIGGQLIGINSMKIARESVEGIGFAIPINLAEPIIEDLELFGEVQRPQMGISLVSLSQISNYHREETLKLPEDVKAGIMIRSVSTLSPADKAGLQELDVIVKMDDTVVKDDIDLRKYLYMKKEVGDELEVTFYRDGKKKTTVLRLEKQSY